MASSSRHIISERPLLILLSIVQFTHIMDFMIMMPLGPQLMKQLSISPDEFSWLIAAYTIMAGVVGLVAAPFIDRFDRRSVLILAYIGFIVGTLFCAVSSTATQLMAARGICGAFGGICMATLLAMVGDIVPVQRRGAAMGIIMTSFSAAAALGVPFGLFLAQKYHWTTPFYLLVGISTVVELLLLAFLPHVRGHLSPGQLPSWQNFVVLLKDSNAWRSLLLTVSLVFGHFTIIPFLAPHLIFNMKYPEPTLPLVYVLGGVLTIITAPIIGKLSDRHGRVRIYTIVVSVATVIIFLLTNAGPLPIFETLLLTTLFFIFASGRYVPAQAVITSAVPSSRRGAFMSLSSCTRDLCTGLAAIMAGKVVQKAPSGALLHVHWLGWLAVVMSVLSIWIIRQIKTVQDPPHPADLSEAPIGEIVA